MSDNPLSTDIVTTINDIAVTSQYSVDYFTQHSNFLNSISKNVNSLIDFCNSVSDYVVLLFRDLFQDFPPVFVLLISISAGFTIYYFLRGSR